MDERERRHKRIMNRLYWTGTIIAILPFIGIAIGFFNLCQGFQKWNDREVKTLRTISEVKNKINFPFPPQTVLTKGEAMFGFGGGKLIAQVTMPRETVAQFLVDCALRQQPDAKSRMSSEKVPTVAEVADELQKSEIGPGKHLTEDELDRLDLNMMFPTGDKYAKNAALWGVNRMQRVYQPAMPWNGSSSLDIIVNMDSPKQPMVYLIYTYI